VEDSRGSKGNYKQIQEDRGDTGGGRKAKQEDLSGPSSFHWLYTSITSKNKHTTNQTKMVFSQNEENYVEIWEKIES